MSVFTLPSTVAVVFIAQLASPQYREREQANQNLRKMGVLAVPYLQSAQQHKNPEIAIRSTFLLTTFYRAHADRLASQASPTDWPHIPWLDMLPQDHPNRDSVVSYYLNRAQQKIGRHGSPTWQDYRLATQMYIHQMFINGHSPQSVQTLLNQMAEAERKWILANGQRYNPPVPMPTMTAQAR